MKQRPHLTVRDVAALWSCKPSTVIAKIKTGALRAINVATDPSGAPRWRITRQAVRDFERARTTQPAPKRQRQKSPRNIKKFF